MDYRVMLLLWCIFAVSGATAEYRRYYKTNIGVEPLETGADSGEFVQPLSLKPFVNVKGYNYAERRSREDSKQQEVDESELLPVPYDDEADDYVQPVHFLSTYNSDGSEVNAEKIRRYLNQEPLDQAPKAASSNEFRASFSPSWRPYRNPPRQSKVKHEGSSSSRRYESPAVEYYMDLYAKKKDVEMILPKDKSIILPMVNGKPKPYDGYRAASDVSPHESDRIIKSRRDDVIYGRPKKSAGPVRPFRIKRAPAEYHGGIYPHFDYSDPENASRLSRDPKGDATDGFKRQKGYPKKHRMEKTDKSYNYYKYPKDIKKTRKRSNHREEAEEEEHEDEEEEEEQDDNNQKEHYKYVYDDSIVVPELRIKYYPYERFYDGGKSGDTKEEGTEGEEAYESPEDEYTAGYESYKKSLTSDLEKYFGKPDYSDYSVEATENLGKNENCEKLTEPRKGEKGENATAEKTNEVCYICKDPKTGGTYEQCAYEMEPKSHRYYYGGSSSYQTKDNQPELQKTEETQPESKSRRRRSTYGRKFDLDSLIFGNGSDVKRTVRENMGVVRLQKPELDRKKYKKNWRDDSEDEDHDRRYHSFGKPDHHGSYSSRRNKKSKNRHDDYEGPRYTYEGPKNPYEGPAETYEGPIDKEYYISSDDRIEDDEDGQSNEESQKRPRKKDFYDFSNYHPDRRQGARRSNSNYDEESESDSEKLHDNYYRPSYGYTSDYRFGPEHFVDDEEVEEERPKVKEEKVREGRGKPSEKKHRGSESRPAAQTDAEEKHEGNVQVFKNGDVCRKKKVDGMICMVCKNERTAATYEQCQYSSKPKDKYYAYGSQKSYRTSDPNGDRRGRIADQDQQPEKSDVIEKKILITKQSKVFQDNSGPLDGFHVPQDLQTSPSDNMEAQVKDPNEPVDGRVTVSRMEPRDGIEGLEEYLYSDTEDKRSSDEDKEYISYDDYIRDIFPEFSERKESRYSGESEEDEDESEESGKAFDPFSYILKFRKDVPSFAEGHSAEKEKDEEEEEDEDEESRSAEASNDEPRRLMDRKPRITPNFFDSEGDDYHKKDIEKALGEFQSRDWSKCKKIVKDKLTCYQCVDEKGVDNEECMYVEGSQPTNQHMAYHERKELKPEASVADKDNATVASTPMTKTARESPKRRIKMLRPKNAREEITEATTATATGEGGIFGRRRVGDLQDPSTRVPDVDVMTPVPSHTTEAVIERATETPRDTPQPWNPKRNKTLAQAMEATAERYRKRKYPAKKFIGERDKTQVRPPEVPQRGTNSTTESKLI